MLQVASEPDLPVPAGTEHNIPKTLQRLEQETGFRMSRQQLSLLIRQGRGPNARSVAHGLRSDIIIEWQDALEWSKQYQHVKRRSRTSVPRPDPIIEDKIDPTLRLYDCFFIHLKEKYSEQWQRFQKIPGKDRIYRLNEIAETALHLAEQLFLAADPENAGFP